MDAMARLKLNRLHLHLTDAAGWRIEIKEVSEADGACRLASAEDVEGVDGQWRTLLQRRGYGCLRGYFTQDDIRELLDYAAKRHITIIPEIEMPSHSEEVLAAYPELSCSHGEHGSSDFCVGNEATFEFVEGVARRGDGAVPFAGDTHRRRRGKQTGMEDMRAMPEAYG